VVAAVALHRLGSGSSRRRAEQAAAARMLQDMTHPQGTGTPK
jgi:dsRNA-specific ribonuclease